MLSKKDVEIIKGLLRPLESEQKKTNKRLDILIRTYDREHTNLERRVARIEKHLGL